MTGSTVVGFDRFGAIGSLAMHWALGRHGRRPASQRERRTESPRASRNGEVLLVEADGRYRDRVLAPSLLAMGFTKIRKARDTAAAERQLARHPGIGIVVTDSLLHKDEDGTAVCRMARDVSLPVVLLTDSWAPEIEQEGLADSIVYKRKASVLETAQAIRNAAHRTAPGA